MGMQIGKRMNPFLTLLRLKLLLTMTAFGVRCGTTL